MKTGRGPSANGNSAQGPDTFRLRRKLSNLFDLPLGMKLP